MSQQWVEWEDEYGEYKSRTNEFGLPETLTKHKQKWYDENPTQEPEPQPPTVEEQLADRDRQISELKLRQNAMERVVGENGLMLQEMLEIQLDTGV